MPLFSPPRNRARAYGFRRYGCSCHGLTLVEMLVTMAIIVIIMVAVFQIMDSVDAAWKSGANDPYAEADEAFETIAKNVSSATLDPYEDEADSSGAFRTNSTSTFVPNHPARRSDLAFVTGPSGGGSGLLASSGRTTTGGSLFFVSPAGYTQTYAHTGMERLLNTLGYFVEFSQDDTTPAFISTSSATWRWRLKQVLQPSESLQIFSLTTSQAWIQQVTQAGASTPVLADNVIALIVLPERAANDTGTALSSDFRYDSRDSTNSLTRNQLPARMKLALVAIDAASAATLAEVYGTNAPPLVAASLFQESTNLTTDLSTLETTLTAHKIGHRIYQRDVLLPAAAWSDTDSD